MAKILLLVGSKDYVDTIGNYLNRHGVYELTWASDLDDYVPLVAQGGWDLILSGGIIDGDEWPIHISRRFIEAGHPVCFLSTTNPGEGVPWINRKWETDEIRQKIDHWLAHYRQPVSVD